jgi:osmotically inducible protein OsmC
MPVRTAAAVWNGGLKDGDGMMRLGSGAYEGRYSFGSRFEEGSGTNPEELIGAAHAGCFSMAFANILAQAGHEPERIETTARVNLALGAGGASIESIELDTTGQVPGIDEETFRRHAEEARRNCPVSRALATEVRVTARLAG